MFLATTALKEFWDTQDEVLLLGPWCVRYDDPDWLADVRSRRLGNVWDDRARLERAAAYCGDLQPELLAKLADYLNAVHGVALSPRYWRILAGPWLLYYTHQLFDRYTQIVEALKEYPDARSLVLAVEDFYIPRDAADFHRFYHTDHCNLQLYSHIFRFLGRDFPARRHAPPPTPKLPPRNPSDRILGFASRCAISLLRPKIVSDDLYPAGRRLLWRLVQKMRGQALPLLVSGSFPQRAAPVDDSRHQGLGGLKTRDEFERLLVSSLPWALPTILLEGFAAARQSSLGQSSHVPRAVMASTGLYYNETFKLAAAEWVERGARLWGLQHGGQYGTAKYSLAERHEREVCDRFFTWGWSASAQDNRAQDLPVPRLSSGASPARSSGEDVLIFSVENVRNAHHLFPHPLGWQWEEYFSWLERFLAGLGPRISQACLRPYPHDYGWGLRQRLSRRFPNLRRDQASVPLRQRLSTTRLAVTDYPGTPFSEILALDKPSVHFWQDSLWESREEARPYFEALREAGVVHPDPESAARHALRIWDDPEAWWQQPKTRAARAAFVERYARTSADWPRVWTETLRRELGA